MPASDSWQVYNPVRIIFDLDVASKIAGYLKPEVQTVLIVTTEGANRRGTVQSLLGALSDRRVVIIDTVTPNPTVKYVQSLVDRFSDSDIHQIVGVGGGSVIDTAKILSVMLPYQPSIKLSKIIQHGFQNWSKCIPVMAIPTTAGTGSEVTPFATVWDDDARKKYSVSGSLVFPKTAILDTNLTLNLPEETTLFTALDAISHALESIWNKNKSPLSEGVAIKSLELSTSALPILMKDLSRFEERQSMLIASCLAGIAISQTRTAIAHSISYPLTAHFKVPHGLACSFSLPNIIELYLDQNPTFSHQLLFRKVQKILLDLKLDSLISRYVTSKNMNKLKQEMLNPERSNNFTGVIENLDRLIQ